MGLVVGIHLARPWLLSPPLISSPALDRIIAKSSPETPLARDSSLG